MSLPLKKKSTQYTNYDVPFLKNEVFIRICEWKPFDGYKKRLIIKS